MSDTRLCCPTCIEFGRTSFFCGQECFTKNWHAHNQLHELLRRKRASADGGSAAAADGGSFGVGDSAGASAAVAAADGDGALGGGSSGSSLPLPRARDTREDNGSVMAPLPGGTSLISGIHKRDRSAQRRSSSREVPRDPEAGDESKSRAGSGPSMLGSWMNQARARFTGGGTAEPARQGRKPDLPGTAEAARRPGRSRSPAPRGGQKAAQPSRSMLSMQTGIWGLVVLTITAGALFYREHLRYVEEQQSVPPAAFLSADLSKQAPEELAEGVAVIKAEDGTEISVIVPEASAASSDVSKVGVAAAIVSAEAAAGGKDSVASLRSEVASLRQSLQRHEQMLRYIMDRYVEKNPDQPKFEGPSPDKADVPVAEAHGHDVKSLNMSVPEFQSKSYTDVAPASPESGGSVDHAAAGVGGRGGRKRSGGLDAVDVPGLGM